MDIQRVHASETGDSEAVNCPNCQGTKIDPVYKSTCALCCGTGFLLQQRFNPNTGKPERVNLVGVAVGLPK